MYYVLVLFRDNNANVEFGERDAYYRFLGWSGFGTSVLSLSFRLVAAQRDREKEYSLILGLNLVPMVVGFAVGVFVLNFLLIPKVQARCVVLGF